MADLTGVFTRISANEEERNAIGAISITQKGQQFRNVMSHVESAAEINTIAADPERVQGLSTTPTEDT